MAVEEGEEAKRSMATLTEYLWSIIYMPSSLRILCLTNLFCWMSLVCYSLYFTDYVGEAVFGGNPAVTLFSFFMADTSIITKFFVESIIPNFVFSYSCC